MYVGFFLINLRLVVYLANVFTKMNLCDFHSRKQWFLNDPNFIGLLAATHSTW